MAYTSWSVVFGEQPSATKWNILGSNDASFNDGTGIGDGVITPVKWSNPYCFSAYASSGTSISDNSPTKVDFATENYDLNNNFASSTYTAPVDGIYNFTGRVEYATSISGGVASYVAIYVNGSLKIKGVQFGVSATETSSACIASGDVQLSATDTVEIYAFQNSDGAETTVAAANSTWFCGHLVAAT